MNFYRFTVASADGTQIPLESIAKNKVVLVVNVASKCGYTPQYKALENLYQKYKDQGFLVIGFPCNQFGNQEPGSNEEIQSFCELNFGVTFPVMGKIEVNGKNTSDLYRWLKKEQKGFLFTEAIKWNFTKFLVDRHGNCVQRIATRTKPEDMEQDIQTLLKTT